MEVLSTNEGIIKILEDEPQGTETMGSLLVVFTGIVKEQIEIIEKLNNYISTLESQLAIQDNAIVRKDTIISYLESKIL